MKLAYLNMARKHDNLYHQETSSKQIQIDDEDEESKEDEYAQVINIKKDDDTDGQKILQTDNLKTGFAFLNPYSEVEPQMDDKKGENLKTGFAFLNPYSEVEPQLDDKTQVVS